MQIPQIFLYMLTVATARSSFDNSVVYFRFCDDVMFSHNGTNGPKSSMMLFRQTRQVAALGEV